MSEPIRVATGFTWTAAGAWASFFALLGLIVRQYVPLRKIQLDADGRLIKTLTDRVESLEHKLDEKDAKHDAEVSLLRHQLVNSDQCLDLLLNLLEDVQDLPERAKAAVKATKAMRRETKERETIEKATLRGVAIARSREASANADYRTTHEKEGTEKP